MLVYVAGKYAPRDCSLHDAPKIAHQNVQLAIEWGNEVIERGHFVFVPHLSHYQHLVMKFTKPQKWWYEYDLFFLDKADAILMLPNWKESTGAKIEYDFALTHSKRIFFTPNEIPFIESEDDSST